MLYKYIGSKFKVNDKTIVSDGDVITVIQEKNEGLRGPSIGIKSITNNTTGIELSDDIYWRISKHLKPLEENCEDFDEEDIKDYDNVNSPEHYTHGTIECINAMISAYGVDAVMNFCQCNAFKYLWRFENKNKIEDLDKLMWYINKYKELYCSKKPN